MLPDHFYALHNGSCIMLLTLSLDAAYCRCWVSRFLTPEKQGNILVSKNQKKKRDITKPSKLVFKHASLP
jgi:hypothetical protein